MSSIISVFHQRYHQNPFIYIRINFNANFPLSSIDSVELPVPALYGMQSNECPIKIPGPQFNIKSSCDRHLLAATHKNLAIGPVLAVLKGILVVADAMNPENQKQAATNKKGNRSTPTQTPPQPAAPKSGSDISHILGTSEGNNATEEETVQPDTP